MELLKRNSMISEAKPIRIIPRLDIKGPNLVKGVHLEGLRVLGEPHDFANYYYENGADELFFQDVVASLYGRNCMQDVITRTANEIFIPLTVGGGIRNIDDIKAVLRCGADKVAINTAAIKNKNLITQAAELFGSSTIVVSIEVLRDKSGKYLAYTDYGREYTGVDAIEWAQEAEELGAGEILITAIDTEGTGGGLEIDLISSISSSSSIPVIAHGGVGTPEHVINALDKTEIDAVCIASMLHYNFIKEKSTISVETKDEGNTEFLMKNQNFKNFSNINIHQLKSFLLENNITIRR